jgi:hypothetical protein
MKFNRKENLSILFITLILLSNVSATSLTIKSHTSNSRRAYSISHSKINTKAGDEGVEKSDKIITKIREVFTTVQHISFFAMGFLSVWIPNVKEIYEKVKKIQSFFEPCAEFLSTLWTITQGEETHESKTSKKKSPDLEEAEKDLKEDQKTISETKSKLDKAEKEKTTPEKKKKRCSEMKVLLQNIYKECNNEKYSYKNEDVRENYIRFSHREPAEDYCKFALSIECTKAQKSIIKHFETKENYLEICINFKNTGDCGNFQPNNKGAWYFIKETLKYGLFVKQGLKCVLPNLLQKGKDDHSLTRAELEVKSIAESTFNYWGLAEFLLKGVGFFILHVLTLGMSGTLKAVWYILKLGSAIYKLVDDFIEEDLPFRIGELVGLGSKIIKSLIGGRKRRR